MFFGTLADIDGHWRTWTDIGGLGWTLADSDGHWRTQTDIGGLRRTRVAKGSGVTLVADLTWRPPAARKSRPIFSGVTLPP